MKNSPPITITSMTETATEHSFSLQNGCCCCCCNWTVLKGKSIFFACPKIVRSPKHMLPGLWTAAILSSSVMTTVTIPVTRFSSSSVGSANNTVLQGKKEINVCWISQLSQDITLLSSVENASCWKTCLTVQATMTYSSNTPSVAETGCALRFNRTSLSSDGNGVCVSSSIATEWRCAGKQNHSR